MNDEELMAAVAEGDRRAYEALVRAHLPAVTRYALRLLGNARDIEDIAQETFLRLWTNASKWDPAKAKLSTWLHRIAHNLCIDLLRKQQRLLLSCNFDEEFDSESDASGSQDSAPANSSLRGALAELAKLEPSSQQAIEEGAALGALNAAMANLSESQRSALLLCHFQGFSNKEAATIAGLSVRALESLMARAKRNLRLQLEANLYEQ